MNHIYNKVIPISVKVIIFDVASFFNSWIPDDALGYYVIFRGCLYY